MELFQEDHMQRSFRGIHSKGGGKIQLEEPLYVSVTSVQV